MKTPPFATAVAKAGGDTEPMGGNSGNLALSQHHGTPAAKPAIAQVHVTESEWKTFVDNHGGYEAHAARVVEVFKHAETTAESARFALVIMGARLVQSDPKHYMTGTGRVNASKVARTLGVEGTANLRTSISKGVPLVLESGKSLYGEADPELIALALAYRNTELANRKRSADKAEAERKPSRREDTGTKERATSEEVVSEESLEVSRLTKIADLLNEAHTLIQQLTDEEKQHEDFPYIGALVDSMSDHVYA